VEVEFGARLRDEMKFSSSEELCAQIARDVERVRLMD
jgi:FAD synthase